MILNVNCNNKPALHVSLLCLSFIYEVLERAHLTYSNKTAVYEALEQISGYLAGRRTHYHFIYHL